MAISRPYGFAGDLAAVKPIHTHEMAAATPGLSLMSPIELYPD